ncbi:MAG TPA: MFS transporter, partial [Steroidobacteraceae bacterium]|nr:MFS transporter [Steroidobacteraceae bacterium]
MRRAAGGERVLLGSMLGLALSPGTIVFYTLGVLMEPITAATGWTRGQVSFAASVFTAVLIFAIPAVGRLLDRFGVRAVLLPSIALFGFALIAAGRASTLWQLYLAFAALAALGAGANSVSYMRAVCTWFDRHRGLAIGIAQSGMGIGVMLMPTLTQALLQRGGWSFAYAGLGACVLLIALPVVALLVVEAPPVGAAPVKPSAPSVEPAASAPAAEHRGAPAVEHPGAAAADGVPPAEALRQLRFWILVVGFFLLAGAINSAALHLVPLLQTSGVARDTALLAASVFGGAMLLGRIMTGLLVDRYFAAYIAAV